MNIGTRLGPYEIIEAIGAGGMGEVYRARDPRVGRDVAIKISSEQFTDRFSREIHAVAALNHPNVATLYDVGPNYLVMELVEGETLREWIARAPGRAPLHEVLEIARQIADALEAAHEKGIIHRDLKPANIKIKPDGTVKVLDFGLAKVGDTPAVSSENSPTLSYAQTAAGMILGTAAYMSPEQAKGKPVDKRADIWAFGVVLYEMLMGKQLFSGETVSDTLAAVLTKEPDWGKVPAKVRLLLERCLERDPKRRLRDIGEAMIWIEKAPEPKQVKRPWLAWCVAALFLLVALVAFSFNFRARNSNTGKPVTFQIPSAEVDPLFSVSPDGSRLAFWARSSENTFRIWISPLNSLDARELPGTEHSPQSGRMLCWSPDSRFIAFESEKKLKKIDVSSGSVQTLCDLPEGGTIGGSWGSKGVIVFSVLRRGVMRVSAAGGTVSTVLLSQPPSTGEIGPFHPYFLPDGRHFLYYHISRNLGKRVFVGSLDDEPGKQNSTQLLADPSVTDFSLSHLLTQKSYAYVPAAESRRGQLLFLRENTLYAQEFDAGRLKLKGEPNPLAEQIRAFTASSNNILVTRSGTNRDPSDQIDYQITWFDFREGKALGEVGEPGPYIDVTPSPDGTLAAAVRRNGTKRELWLIDLARGTSMRFFSQGSSADSPIWSPDGTRIAFSVTEEAGDNRIYLKPVDSTKKEEMLYKSEKVMSLVDWSRDGRFLLYRDLKINRPDLNANQDIWVLPLTSRKPSCLLCTEFAEAYAQFSPDGKWIAYESNETGRSEVYVRPFLGDSGKEPPGLGPPLLISLNGGYAAWWIENGQALSFQSLDRNMMEAEFTNNPVFPFGKPHFLRKVDSRSPFGDITDDGKRILCGIPVPVKPEPFTVTVNWPALLK